MVNDFAIAGITNLPPPPPERGLGRCELAGCQGLLRMFTSYVNTSISIDNDITAPKLDRNDEKDSIRKEEGTINLQSLADFRRIKPRGCARCEEQGHTEDEDRGA